MSLILEEFEKENIEEAVHIFNKKIQNYDVIGNHKLVIAEYCTPKNYIADNTRGLTYDDVSETTLDFIICKCRRCPLKIRMEATKALLSKYYDKIKTRYCKEEIDTKLSSMKDKILISLEQTANDISLGDEYDFSELQTGIYGEILYLIQIKIGSNYLKKIGYTTRETMRPRVAEIKSSYRSSNKKIFNISIKPIYIYSIDNAKQVEQEFILKVKENQGNFGTSYKFDGSDECLTGKYSKLADTVFLEVIGTLKKDKFQIIFG